MDLVQRLIGTHARRTAVLHDRGWVWLRVILTGLVLSRGLVLLCVMPPFRGVGRVSACRLPGVPRRNRRAPGAWAGICAH